jgi:hypothetical protein
MRILIKEIEHHRNGIAGAPFDVVRFTDKENGNMVGIVFEDSGSVAILNIDKLAAGCITFGVNSWRGDEYEGDLRKAIEQKEKDCEKFLTT